MGLAEYFDFTIEEWYDKQLEPLGIDIKHLKEKGPYYKYAKEYGKFPYQPKPYKPTSRSGKLEIYSLWLAEDFYRNPGSPYKNQDAVDPLPHDVRTMKRNLRSNEFYLVTGKSAINAHSGSAGNRYLNEDYLGDGIGLHKIWLPAQKAKEIGIENNDTVWVESDVTGARSKAVAKVTEGIHPTTAFVYHQFGAASRAIPTEIGSVGLFDNDFQPHNEEPLSGGLGRCQMIVKISK